MDTSEKKSTRVRSVAYPSYTIHECVEFVKRISQVFGNTTYNKREDIASELDMSVGSVLMRLSSATQYSLLDMVSKEGYKPTEIFTSIYKPLSSEEKRSAEIACLSSPELYQKLIEHYRGKQLPAIGGLAILLYRSYKVSEEASSKAAKVFLENLIDLSLVDVENRLKSTFDEAETEEVYVQEEPAQEVNLIKDRPKSINPSFSHVENVIQTLDSAPPIPIFLKGENRIAKLFMPADYTDDDLDYVIRIITAYRRP